MPEWSKGADLRSASASCVGSNPTLVTISFFNSLQDIKRGKEYGDVAQMVERSLCMRKVAGSMPVISMVSWCSSVGRAVDCRGNCGHSQTSICRRFDSGHRDMNWFSQVGKRQRLRLWDTQVRFL
jgi:hypothetical protein